VGLGTRALRRAAPPDHERFELRFDPGTVTQITVRQAQTDVRLVLHGDVWWIVEPVEIAASRARVEALLAVWGQGWAIDSVRIASPSRTEARDHGLMEERLEVQFEDDVDTLLRVEIGRPLSEGQYPVRLGGGRTIYEASVPHIEMLQPRIEAWLDPDVVPFAPDQLEALRLQHEGRVTTMWFGRETGYAADGLSLPADRIPGWLEGARTRFATVEATPASPAEAAQLGASLAHPRLVVEAETERRGSYRMEIGESLPREGHRAPGSIARIEGHPTLYVVGDHTLRALRALLPAEAPRGVPPAPSGPEAALDQPRVTAPAPPPPSGPR
jgi:hypothetical protein